MQQCAPSSAADRNGNGVTIDDTVRSTSSTSAPEVVPDSQWQQDIHSDVIPPLEETCRDLYERVQALLAQDTQDNVLRQVQAQTRTSLAVIEDALSRYGLEHLCFSYNGGKDCLVLLILYLVGVYAHLRGPSQDAQRTAPTNESSNRLAQDNKQEVSHGAPAPATFNATQPISRDTSTPSDAARAPQQNRKSTPFPTQLTSIYIQTPHPFPEVTSFVVSSSAYYHLNLVSSALPMKAAFTEYLKEHQEVQAIFVGTRRTDPHGGNLTFFDPTDRGWPKFMRIHPVIDWHYREIWGFIRHLNVPYCTLYDLGYTSLGGTNDTHPNPKLAASTSSSAKAVQSGAGQAESAKAHFRPAYELIDDDEERLGRE